MNLWESLGIQEKCFARAIPPKEFPARKQHMKFLLKKCVFKYFAKFTRIFKSCGTFKNTFFHRTPPVATSETQTSIANHAK